MNLLASQRITLRWALIEPITEIDLSVGDVLFADVKVLVENRLLEVIASGPEYVWRITEKGRDEIANDDR